MDKELWAALQADGEKLRALTGKDHGPWVVPDEECPRCGSYGFGCYECTPMPPTTHTPKGRD